MGFDMEVVHFWMHHLLLMWICAIQISSTANAASYTKDPSFNDLVCPHNERVMTLIGVRSKSECASHCTTTEDCNSVFYVLGADTADCVGCSLAYSSTATLLPVASSSYYVKELKEDFSHGGSMFKIIYNQFFDIATLSCLVWGGHGAVVDSTEKHDAIVAALTSLDAGDVYFGMRKTLKGWTWVANDQKVKYTNWHSSQPDGGFLDNCAILQKELSYQWADVGCLVPRNMLCEKAL